MIEEENMKKKILFVNDEMTMGGVARILIGLLNKIDLDIYDVDVLILHPHGELLNEIPEGINILDSHPFFNVVDSNFKDLLKNRQILKIVHKILLVLSMKTRLIIRILKSIRKSIIEKSYDIEFSAKEGFCTIFVSCGDSIKKINWVQVDYSVSNYSKNHMGLMIDVLKNIDLNIACSEKVGKSYSEIFRTNKVKVVNNFIDTEVVKTKLNEVLDVPKFPGFTFITVARFHPQKSVDRLVEAFSYVHKMNPNTRLIIIGDGEQKDLIQDLIILNKLESSVELLGILKNPYPYIKGADIFILSSLYEGFPTIIIESLLCGTPVLATNVAGVSEQIIKEEYGWIVNNTKEDLQEKMLEISRNPNIISNFKQRLLGYKYPNEEILNAYYNIFS